MEGHSEKQANTPVTNGSTSVLRKNEDVKNPGNDQDTQDNEPDEDVVKIEETSELLRNSKYVKNASSEESLVVQLVKDTKDESLLETCVTEDPVRDGETPVQIQTDGGWGWVVCMASLIANGIVNATINTFGILYVALVKEFADNDRDKAFKTSWVGSVAVGLSFLMSAVAGVASDRFGLRKVAFAGGFLAFVGMLSSAFVQDLMLLYLTYGVCIGVGFAFPFTLSVVILGHYFKKRLGLVNGIATFGSCAFSLLYSLMIPALMKSVGLKYTLLCLSGVHFLLMPCALTWKPRIRRQSKSLTSKKESLTSSGDGGSETKRQDAHKFLNVKIWRNRGYLAWAAGTSTAYLGYLVPFFHMVKHSDDLFPESNSSLLPLSTAIAIGVSRLGFGLLTDVRCLNPVHMQQAALLTLGITTICIPTAHSFAGLVVISIVVGACDGLFFFLNGPIVFSLVGERDASQALGFFLSTISVPITVGPPLAGLLYDHLGSYTVAFHVAGITPIAGALIMLLIPRQTQSGQCCGSWCPGCQDNSSRSVERTQSLVVDPDVKPS